jgi:hypothetical protein
MASGGFCCFAQQSLSFPFPGPLPLGQSFSTFATTITEAHISLTNKSNMYTEPTTTITIAHDNARTCQSSRN